MCADENRLITLDSMYTLALERIELELILFSIIWTVKLLSNVVFRVKDLMYASFLFSFHQDLNIFGFDSG